MTPPKLLRAMCVDWALVDMSKDWIIIMIATSNIMLKKVTKASYWFHIQKNFWIVSYEMSVLNEHSTGDRLPWRNWSILALPLRVFSLKLSCCECKCITNDRTKYIGKDWLIKLHCMLRKLKQCGLLQNSQANNSTVCLVCIIKRNNPGKFEQSVSWYSLHVVLLEYWDWFQWLARGNYKPRWYGCYSTQLFFSIFERYHVLSRHMLITCATVVPPPKMLAWEAEL